jgi:putative ABC transport system permease protein
MRLYAELLHAIRRLRRHLGFTTSGLLTLGAGLGASIAMFAVVHGVVLNPLPYPDSARLVRLDHSAPGIGSEGGLQLTQGLYLLYRESSQMLSDLAVYSDADVTITGNGPPRRLTATISTHELAGVLRVRPALGRFLAEQDGRPGAQPVAVLSYALWNSAFGSDPAIVGRSIMLNGVAVAVVGVMPSSFGFPSRETDLWLPREVNPVADRFGSFTLAGIARLAPRANVESAREELQQLIPRLLERFPGPTSRQVVDDARLTALVVPLKEAIVGPVAATLWVLSGTVGLLLLIAGVNVTNLMVVSVERRNREIALRTALGAGPRAIAAYFLSETAWLAGLSGAIGFALAAVALGLVRRFGPEGLPRLEEIGLTPTVWAVGLSASAAAALFLGLIPFATRRSDLDTALRQGSRTTADRARFRGRNALVVSQTAFALVLIVGAGLMARSFWNLTQVDAGFDAGGLLTFQIALPEASYPTRESTAAFHSSLLARLRSLPGVDRVGATTCLPLCGSWAGNPWARQDRPVRAGEIPPIVATRRVSEDYFESMGIALLSGRTIERQDLTQLSGAAVINREAAKKLFPGEDPIGKRIYHATDPDNPPWYHVVGIVEDAPVTTLTADRAPVAYLPLMHRDAAGLTPRLLAYAVRTSLAPLSLVDAIRAEIRQLDPALPIAHVRTMKSVLREAQAGMAFTMVLLVITASMALFLGIVGIYSVIAYTVSQRLPEFGLRLAIGARATDVWRMVLRQSGALVGIGILIGISGAFVLTRFMRAMVFGVSTTDPLTYAAVTMILVGVSTLAIVGPARRAATVDPMESLRAE